MKYSLEQAKDIISKSIQVNSLEFIGCGNHSEAFCVNHEIVIKGHFRKFNPLTSKG